MYLFISRINENLSEIYSKNILRNKYFFKLMNIKDKIHTIRGIQVILDRDLAGLYEVETKRLNEQVKRNIKRFPKTFMFQLTMNEAEKAMSNKISLNKGSQIATPFKKLLGGSLPYAFTEQGIAMLSGVLRSDKAVEVSIKIIEAFVAMRKFIAKNAELFIRLDSVDRKLIEHDEKFEQVFDALEVQEPKQGVFFDGQIFDAYKFVSDLIRKAKKRIILIDNYVDDSVLTLFSKNNVEIMIYTKINKRLKLDVKKFNSQYGKIILKDFDKSHDRFLIIDDCIYHFGASLKDLGKKWFAFSKLQKESFALLEMI